MAERGETKRPRNTVIAQTTAGRRIKGAHINEFTCRDLSPPLPLENGTFLRPPPPTPLPDGAFVRGRN